MWYFRTSGLTSVKVVCYLPCMAGEIREFLTLDKEPVSESSVVSLQDECATWRLVYSLLPPEVMVWVGRMHDVVRFTRRNYQGSTGILLNFKMEPVEFTIGVTETAFNPLTGQRVVEDKVLVIPAAAIMYHEFIGDVREYDPAADEQLLGATELG